MSRARGTARDPAARAARLLRWYPATWRDRYGEEFAELLASDIEERPGCAARTLDVAGGGLVARVAAAGLGGVPLRDASRHVTASLVSLGCCLALFWCVGAAMWSQLTIGWQWAGSAGTGAAVTVATVAMSVAMPALLILAVLAALPVLAAVARHFARRQAGDLLAPSAVLIAAAAVVFAGGRHFGNGWPGTGGTGGLVPGGLAAFAWAMSLSVSSYWAHPGALAAFPPPEVAWMAVSPLALAAAGASAAIIVRRSGLSRRVLLFETRLAIAACAAMAVGLAGAGGWVATAGRPVYGQPSLFSAGFIDVAGIALLALALAVALQAARTARRGLRLARG